MSEYCSIKGCWCEYANDRGNCILTPCLVEGEGTYVINSGKGTFIPKPEKLSFTIEELPDLIKRNEILQDAIKHYGETMQQQVAIEEMAELTKELVKWARGDHSFERVAHVLEEIADVQIMLDQLKIIFGPTDGFEDVKLRRLQQRIEEGKE